VAGLNSGRSHVGDISDADIARCWRAASAPLLGSGCGCPGNRGDLRAHAAVRGERARSDAIRSATETVGRLLRRDARRAGITTYPGTTDEVVRRYWSGREADCRLDFSLAFSRSGSTRQPALWNRNTPKVVGGQTPSCADAAIGFYGKLCDRWSAPGLRVRRRWRSCWKHVPAYQHRARQRDGDLQPRTRCDLWDAIRCAATKPFGFQPSTRAPASVATASRSIRTTSPTRSGRWGTVPLRRTGPGDQWPHARYVADRAAELLNDHAKPLKGARCCCLA